MFCELECESNKYADGATVDGLFCQDAMNDVLTVAPVFIAGLPADEGEDTQP